ncbi:MAG: plasmid pRiA4b ORF-3 family protein [Streptococcaceae bacterium]|jgi:hypothetical protein|nr:plasmid pRiA4b ORF-3 family protein [Streptococcaceae bacterium]
MAKSPIYVFEAKLKESSVENVRKFSMVASSTKNLADLAYLLLAAYNLGGDHLFGFRGELSERTKTLIADILKSPFSREEDVNDLTYFNGEPKDYTDFYLPNPYDDFSHNPLISESVFESKLVHVLRELGQKLEFTYDFGDDWDFEVTLTEIITDEKLNRRLYPKLISGNGFDLEEDMGGVSGLEEAIEQGELLPFDMEMAQLRFRSHARWLKWVYEEQDDTDA